MDQNEKNQSSRKVFTDYIPAEIQGTKGDNWRIVYYCRIPGQEKLKRFRIRVKKIANKFERKKLAKRICAEVNKKLNQGWTPFNSGNSGKEYTLLKEAISRYCEHNRLAMGKGQLRPDTFRSYQSMSNLLMSYLNLKGKEDLLCAQFNRQFVTQYADYIFFEKKRSARTGNNYIKWCITFANFLVDRGYLNTNSIEGISFFKEKKKRREIIDSETRATIFNHLSTTNPQYLTICLMIYFCFIRRKEIAMMKVSNVQLDQGIIIIPSSFSKNGKDEAVTIPAKFINNLKNHIGKAPGHYFLFSDNKLKPGVKAIAPKYISDVWSSLRKKLGFKNTYQFYSLKDTGITQLFMMGVPSIKIRDQARHQDLKTTEIYTPRKYDRDDFIANMDFDF
tara:strand:- start:26865 stop:28037 length:1173 start_codon:yes stop_codon:yes gene_type:complete